MCIAAIRRSIALRWCKRFAVLILSSILLFNMSTLDVDATDGDLDPTFGNMGIVLTDFSDSRDPTTDDFLTDIAVQPDGKIVAVGLVVANLNGSPDFAISRYEASGALDQGFGVDGRVTTNFFPGSSSSSDQANAVALQLDGKIVVAGIANDDNTNFDFAVARYNSDGSLDASFGNGGKVTTALVANTNDVASDLAIQQDGKIVVVGHTYESRKGDVFAIVRYNGDGSLDSSFGTGGVVMTDFSGDDKDCDGSCNDRAQAMAIQRDGRIVAVGFTTTTSARSFALARYDQDGNLDSTFGAGGKVTTGFSGTFSDAGRGVALQTDGKIIAAGNTSNSGTGFDFGVARYNNDGSLDSNFGIDGKTSIDFSSHADEASAVAIQRDGNIVLAGRSFVNSSSDSNFALTRLNSDGNLDTSFGIGGKVITQTTNFENRASAVVAQQDGKILAAGSAFNPRNGFGFAGFDFALVRYSAVSFDLCVQDDGNGKLLQFNSVTGEYQFDDCSGIILSGKGSSNTKGSIITLQHYYADRRLLARIDTSANKGTASIQIFSLGRTFTILDPNTVNNTCTCASR